MSQLLEAKNYESSKVEIGDPTSHTSKNDIEYSKIDIKYGGGLLLLRVPKCKTMGIQSTETENGYTRRTMPLVFDDPLTVEQSEFVEVFSDIARITYEKLAFRGYSLNKLTKLESCFWRSKILYASVCESVFDASNNSRYFVGGEEVGRKDLAGEYDAVAAVLIDSIYDGPKTVSLQVKLYEVSLSQASKRTRVL